MNNEKKLLLYLAAGVIAVCMVYFFCITFIPVPQSGQRYADLILGALIGSGFTALLSYWFGSSKGSADKDTLLRGPDKPPTGVR